jgi:hypothetical protein
LDVLFRFLGRLMAHNFASSASIRTCNCLFHLCIHYSQNSPKIRHHQSTIDEL